jgi:hypothetical protein
LSHFGRSPSLLVETIYEKTILPRQRTIDERLTAARSNRGHHDEKEKGRGP